MKKTDSFLFALMLTAAFTGGLAVMAVHDDSTVDPTTKALTDKLNSANTDLKNCADRMKGYTVFDGPGGSWYVPGQVEPFSLNDADGEWVYVDPEGNPHKLVTERKK